FRRQVEIRDLGKLLSQYRDEHFVERDTEYRGFVRRLASVRRVIDRRLAKRDALDGEHGKRVDFIVIAGVIAERTFRRNLIRMDETFQHDLRARRYMQIAADAFHECGLRTAQETRERIFAQRIRHRRHRAEYGRGIGAERDGNGEWLAGIRLLPFLEIQRAT